MKGLCDFILGKKLRPPINEVLEAALRAFYIDLIYPVLYDGYQ